MGTSIRTLDGDETSFSGCRRCRGILERQDSVVNYRSSELGKILEKKDLAFFRQLHQEVFLVPIS